MLLPVRAYVLFAASCVSGLLDVWQIVATAAYMHSIWLSEDLLHWLSKLGYIADGTLLLYCGEILGALSC